MIYKRFLDRIIDEGSKAAQKDYVNEPEKLAGSMDGFAACRGKTLQELDVLLEEARQRTAHARLDQAPDYWRHRCYEAEVAWVCHMVAAALAHRHTTPALGTATKALC